MVFRCVNAKKSNPAPERENTFGGWLVVNPEPRDGGMRFFAGGVGEFGGEGFGPDYIMLRNGTVVAVLAEKTEHRPPGVRLIEVRRCSSQSSVLKCS